MQELEREFHQIAVREGVSDQEARKLAREFGHEVRDLSKPDPPPHVLIRERGDDYLIFLQSKDKERARDYLDQQDPRKSYTLSSITQKEGYNCHTFTPSQEESSDSSSSEDSIRDIFENLPYEEQQDALKSLEEMAKGG